MYHWLEIDQRFLSHKKFIISCAQQGLCSISPIHFSVMNNIIPPLLACYFAHPNLKPSSLHMRRLTRFLNYLHPIIYRTIQISIVKKRLLIFQQSHPVIIPRLVFHFDKILLAFPFVPANITAVKNMICMIIRHKTLLF